MEQMFQAAQQQRVSPAIIELMHAVSRDLLAGDHMQALNRYTQLVSTAGATDVRILISFMMA